VIIKRVCVTKKTYFAMLPAVCYTSHGDFSIWFTRQYAL